MARLVVGEPRTRNDWVLLDANHRDILASEGTGFALETHGEHESCLDMIDSESAMPTGQVVRSDVAHGHGYWHAAVTVLVVDEDRRIAAQRRGEAEPRGRWDVSVAGHVDPGETDKAATLREQREEISLRVPRERLQRVELLEALPQPQAARAPV